MSHLSCCDLTAIWSQSYDKVQTGNSAVSDEWRLTWELHRWRVITGGMRNGILLHVVTLNEQQSQWMAMQSLKRSKKEIGFCAAIYW